MVESTASMIRDEVATVAARDTRSDRGTRMSAEVRIPWRLVTYPLSPQSTSFAMKTTSGDKLAVGRDKGRALDEVLFALTPATPALSHSADQQETMHRVGEGVT